MIDYMTPVELNAFAVEIEAQIVAIMSPQDYQSFCQYRMMKFPDWLSSLIEEEAQKSSESFYDFVLTSCKNELVERIQKRGMPHVHKRIRVSESDKR